ncbi:MAG: hypothetical protein ACTSRW_12020 [Candidatus Helarchaeota archaeon]
MKDIEEIWIINSSGIPVFNVQTASDLDPILVAGFLSSLETYVKSMGDKKINSISLGESKIILKHGNHGFLFISRSKRNAKEKKIMKSLDLIEKEFFKKYEHILEKWSGDTEVFEDFISDIDRIFKTSAETKAKESLW